MINYQPNQDFTRALRWFNKKGSDRLIGSEIINQLSGSFLRNLLLIGDEKDPSLENGWYLIPEEQVYKLQQYIQHPINTQKYDYFIGTYARN